MPWLGRRLVCSVLLKCVLWLVWCGFFPLLLCAHGLQSWCICLEAEGSHCLRHHAAWGRLLQGPAAHLPGPGGVLCFAVFSDWQCSGMSWAFAVEQNSLLLWVRSQVFSLVPTLAKQGRESWPVLCSSMDRTQGWCLAMMHGSRQCRSSSTWEVVQAACLPKPTAAWQQHHGRSTQPSCELASCPPFRLRLQAAKWPTAVAVNSRRALFQEQHDENLLHLCLEVFVALPEMCLKVTGRCKVPGCSHPFWTSSTGIPQLHGSGWEHVAAPSVAAVGRTRAVFAWTHCLKFSVTARREALISLLFVSTVTAKWVCKQLSAWWKCFLQQHFC